jgi:hypothetical protein
MNNLITKLTIPLFVGITLFSISCKKDTPTPVAPVVPIIPTVVDTLCDGVPGNSKYLPLAIGNKWKYGRTYNVPGNDDYIEEIIGTTVYNGITYFEVHVTDAAFGQNIDYEKLYREDTNGDVYELRYGQPEHLIIPGNPVVGDVVWQNYKVVDLNASVTTGECTYTGCLKIMDDSFLQIYYYYKPGVGMVENSDNDLEEVWL